MLKLSNCYSFQYKHTSFLGKLSSLYILPCLQNCSPGAVIVGGKDNLLKVFLLIMAACSNSLNDEQKMEKSFISGHNINILSAFKSGS